MASEKDDLQLKQLRDEAERAELQVASLRVYTRDLRIAEGLAEADPHNTLRQHDLAASHNKLGDALAACGDTARALEHNTRALHVREQLAEAEPHDTGWQRDLSLSLEKVGDVLAGRGDTASALEHYTRALHIREQLADTDPQNAAWQPDLRMRVDHIAAASQSAGDPSAVDHWAKAHHIPAALDPAGKLPGTDREILDWVADKLRPK
jgi:tetratricopeptide (TPR) repeat protein